MTGTAEDVVIGLLGSIELVDASIRALGDVHPTSAAIAVTMSAIPQDLLIPWAVLKPNLRYGRSDLRQS